MPKRGCGGDGARVAPQHRRIPTMSATRLTETQWMVLSAASQRDDHCAMLPPGLRGGAAQKVVKKLIDLGLVEAVLARGDLPVWRGEDDGCPMALRLTSRGLERIQAERGELGPNQQGSVLEQEVCEDGRESILLPPRQGSPERAVQRGGSRTSSFRRPRWLQAGAGHRHASAPRGRDPSGHHGGDGLAAALGPRVLLRSGAQEAPTCTRFRQGWRSAALPDRARRSAGAEASGPPRAVSCDHGRWKRAGRRDRAPA